jgi:hypothetical protein
MKKTSGWTCACTAAALLMMVPTPAAAATLYVAAGGDLQAALDAARPGDSILLAEGAEFVGNFVLPAKSGDSWITLRTSAPDPLLPARGTRIRPAHAPLLARLRSPNGFAALSTAAGAHHWAIKYLEFAANQAGAGDIIQLGDGSPAQNTLALVPHHLTLTHVYVHGDLFDGQKRGIALNAAHVTIADSYVSECKAVGQDSQAIGGWNGPGPYVIENNYLEAAGENVMFGGADPAIPNLVADGITFRRNYLSRPMAWRDPVLAVPEGPAASVQAGGSLGTGAYSYRVVARRPINELAVLRSVASAEVTVSVTAAGKAVRVQWQPVAGATEYRVYGRTAGAQDTFWTVATTAFVDTGAAGTIESVPTTAGTRWSVKNLFELKNARNVVVEDNVLENHWKESQPGYAIVLTPRNSNGTCTWCVVEHVRFEYNVIRNVSAGVNLTGYDGSSRPTRQSNDIVLRHNLFAGLQTSLGGNAWFMLIGDGPRDVVVEHNTIDANGTNLVNVYGGSSADPREVYGFRMVANAARHGAYGINGSYFSYGNGILNNYYPDAVFTANYLAGGPSSRYPAGNLFQGVFTDQFANPAAGDFTLRAGSVLIGAGPGGADIGADVPTLAQRVAGVDTGTGPAGQQPPNVEPTASFAVSCVDLSCTFADRSSDSDGTIASWGWTFGAAGTASVPSPTFVFPAPGSYTVTLTVADDDGAVGVASLLVQVVSLVHAGLVSGTTTRWDSRTKPSIHYWSADVKLAVHGADERPIAGALVTAAWSGALTKSVSCVTAASGECTFKSGTLSMLRLSVTLTVTNVTASQSAYAPAASHGLASSPAGQAVTFAKP